MNTPRIAAVFAMVALAFATVSTTWAAGSDVTASEQAKKQLKQKPVAGKNINAPMKMKAGAQYEATERTTQSESKKFDTLSNASRSRHDKEMNSIRNER